MKYDFSFLDKRYEENVMRYINASIKLLGNDNNKAIVIIKNGSQAVISMIGDTEKIKLEEDDLSKNIDELKSNKIIDDNIYFKLKYIEGEWFRVQSSNYTISKETAETCLDSLYEFIKWYSEKYESNKIDEDDKEEEITYKNTMYNKTAFSYDDLNIFNDEYKNIENLLFIGKQCIENEENERGYSPNLSITNSRMVAEEIVVKIQNKYDINPYGNLMDKIDTLQALVDEEMYFRMGILRKDGNKGVHVDQFGNVISDEVKAISCLNAAYEVATWYLDFIKKPKDTIKPKHLHKKWKKNGCIEGTYDGLVLINKRDGKGTMHYKNDDIYKGDWKDDKKHGIGILKYANGDRYDGQWKFNKKDGNGIMVYHNRDEYNGEWKDDKKHGIGTLKYDNGDKYDGQWKFDKKDGKGKMIYNNKDEYNGEWKDDKKHGTGTLKYNHGDKYDGQFKLDKKHGRGKLIKKNGDKIEGEWKEDNLEVDYNKPKEVSKPWNGEGNYKGMTLKNKRDGKGTMSYKNGDKYTGEWKEDKKHGYGIEKLKNGVVFEGEWTNGEKNGVFTKIENNKYTYKGQYSKDKAIGEWKLTDNKGNVFVGKFKDNKFIEKRIVKGKLNLTKWNNEGKYEGYILNSKRHGFGTMEYNNGEKYEGDWKDDKRHGKGKIIYKDNSTYEGIWENDIANGYFTKIDKDNVIYRGMVINGVPQANWEVTEANGNLSIHIYNGKQLVFYKYVRGSYSGEWNSEGIYEGSIEDGQRHGTGKMKYKDGHEYNGEWYKDKKHGQGKLTYPNQSEYLNYDGEFKDNQLHGNGKLIYKNGDIENGIWLNNKKNGDFKIRNMSSQDVYIGKFKDDKYIGTWILKKPDGSTIEVKRRGDKFINPKVDTDIYSGKWNSEGTYNGEILNKKRHGQGKMEYTNGDVYEGKFKEDKRNGKGKLITKDGRIYEGQFKEDKIEGKGKRIYKSGNEYEGEFKDGKRDGQGKLTYKNGDVYEGKFKDSKKHGQGKLTTKDGSQYTGKCENDEYIGQWILTKLDGKKVDVIRKDGKFVEIIKEKSNNGVQKYKGEWKKEGTYVGQVVNGKRHGQGQMIYIDGVIYNGKFRDDKRHGKGELVDQDKSTYTGGWINDKKHGTFKIVTSNKLIYTGECKDDKYVDTWKRKNLDGSTVDVIRKGGKFVEVIKEKPKSTNETKYHNGKWKNEGTYKGQVLNGKRHGQGNMEYTAGPTYEGLFKNDKKNGKGKITYKENSSYDYYEGLFKDDKMHGQGELKYSDGTSYKGSWTEGKKNGTFKIVTSNKLIYTGQCKNDEYIGTWKRKNLDGSTVDVIRKNNKFVEVIKQEPKPTNETKYHNGKWKNEGTYIGQVLNGKRHGQGKMEYTNGDVYEGSFKNDKKNGKGELKYSDGTSYKGSWTEGKKNGTFEIVTSNKLIYTGQCKNDKYVGRWIRTYPDGKSVEVVRKSDEFVIIGYDLVKDILFNINSNNSSIYTVNHNKFQKLLTNACNKYAHFCEDEKPILIHDNTIFGSAKEGFVLTNKYIHYKQTFEKPNKVLLKDIHEVDFDVEYNKLILHQLNGKIEISCWNGWYSSEKDENKRKEIETRKKNEFKNTIHRVVLKLNGM